jgi:hypothetical protein
MKTTIRLVIAALLLGAAACSKNTKETATTADGSKVTLEKKGDQASMEIKDKSGGKTTLNVSDKGMQPVTELPKDVPVYPKAVLKMDNASGGLRMMGFYTPDPGADAVKFYAEELKKLGWTIDANMAMGDGHMVRASKGARACNLMIAKDGKETYLQLTLSGKD